MLSKLRKRVRSTLARLTSKATRAKCTSISVSVASQSDAVEPIDKPVLCEPKLDEPATDVPQVDLTSEVETMPGAAFAMVLGLNFPSIKTADPEACDQSHLSSESTPDPEHDTNFLSPFPFDKSQPFAYSGFVPSSDGASSNEYDHDRALANWYKVKAAIRVARAFRQPPTPSDAEVVKLVPPPIDEPCSPPSPDQRPQHDDTPVNSGAPSSVLAVCSAGTKSGVASRPLTLHRDSDDTRSAYSEGSDSDLDELDEANAYCYYNYDEVPRTIHDAAHDMYFQILGRLGFGSFGTVQRALYLPDYKSCGLRIIPGIGIVAVTRREVPCAIKIMHKDKIYQYHGGRCGVRQEERALKRATHSGLFGLTTAWAMWDDAINVYFAMPLYHRNLSHYIRDSEELLQEPKRLQALIAELILAVHNLHKIGVMHRDIKHDNILVSSTGHIALADYGLAYVHHAVTPLYPNSRSSGRYVVLKEFCGGTDAYLAPEVVENLADHNRGYTCKVDVWAMGVVIYELVLGLDRPWFAEALDVRRERIRRARERESGAPKPEEPEIDAESTRVRQGIWKRVSSARFDWDSVDMVDVKLTDLLKKMLNHRPKKRISTMEAFDHPYFEGINWEELGHEFYGPLGSSSPPLCHRDTGVTFRSFDDWKCAGNGLLAMPTYVKNQREIDSRYPKAHLYVHPKLEEELAKVSETLSKLADDESSSEDEGEHDCHHHSIDVNEVDSEKRNSERNSEEKLPMKNDSVASANPGDVPVQVHIHTLVHPSSPAPPSLKHEYRPLPLPSLGSRLFPSSLPLCH